MLKLNRIHILHFFIQNLRHFIQYLKYKKIKGYNYRKYWDERFREFGLNPKGSGDKTLSINQNEELYDNKRKIIYQLINKYKIHFNSVIEIGVGSGKITKLMEKLTKNYIGTDVTNILFDDLRTEFKNFTFIQKDITQSKLMNKYDLILMIDVTQHIVEDKMFNKSMNNIKSGMTDDSFFFVTTYGYDRYFGFYEKARIVSSYEKHFNVIEKISFNDKLLLVCNKKVLELIPSMMEDKE